MWYAEGEFTVTIGTVTFVNVRDILVYGGESVFSIKRSERDGLLGIGFDIRSENGAKIAVVRNGNIYEGDKDKYAVDAKRDRYTLTEKSTGRVICDIRKRAEAKGVELDLSFELYMKDGVLFRATPAELSLDGRAAKLMMSNCTIRGFTQGIVVDEHGLHVGVTRLSRRR
jgi:hypothetical protein